jgi:hypothetical protein
MTVMESSSTEFRKCKLFLRFKSADVVLEAFHERQVSGWIRHSPIDSPTWLKHIIHVVENRPVAIL